MAVGALEVVRKTQGATMKALRRSRALHGGRVYLSVSVPIRWGVDESDKQLLRAYLAHVKHLSSLLNANLDPL